ncbi:dUTP diphosphatase [Lederbergia citrea]|uniref:dUTP diphosphatase n=1 Tax=Lederbergia citrea TaxID=2833581 RepID=A0A942UJP1_9BACI|nr:dUTP diphosphatase [Lederbergia citrea]MBS4176087.1 dUTP diphosphatase [Lederbergia citrea]MBS4202648.1 dUTP diphosphatase [Lederbergia citrea]MBS4222685.1 dUTP diphosphatase [Lederbergia citrea]
MTLHEWYAMQQELDQYIEIEHDLQNTDLVERKLLALLVEMGELANETRCFKFWSKKPASDQDIILEEFVDGIHFILSIGLELGFSERDIPIVSSEGNEDVVQGFLKIYNLVDQLRQSRSADTYEELLRQYFILGQSLGFSIDDVQQAYKAKNEVNYKRQQEGY